MYVLVVRDPEGNETEYDLIGEAVLGRDESADIQMPDSGVSRRHARVFLEDDLCYVEDLGSANGTLLEGQAVVGQVVLEPGRAVSLGPFELWVEDADGAPLAAPDNAPVDDASETTAGPALGVDGQFEDTHGSVPVPRPKGRRMLGTLEGISGAALGQIFEVRDGSTVGRLPGVDIIVEDPSMSRQHAEIRFVHGEVLVRDLESANGTFVNETPVLEQPLQDDDVVTFGSVAFRFVPAAGLESAIVGAGGAALVPGVPGRRGRKGAAGGAPNKRKLLFAVAGVFLVFMVVLIAVGTKKPPPQAGGPGTQAAVEPASANLRTDVFNHMRRGQMLMDSENWSQAEDLFSQAVELDPINADARQKLEQARLESRMETVFEDGNRLAQLGNLEEALKTYMQIEPSSTYRRRARFQTEQLISRMQSLYDRECRGFVRANRFDEALPHCRRYMDFACQCPETMSKATQEALETAERRARVPAAERWRCPSDLEEWVPCASRVATGDSDPAQAAIRQRYSNTEIADAVLNYYRGQVDEAVREMGRAEDGLAGDPSAREQARQLRNAMRLAQNYFRQVNNEVRRNAHEQARAALDELIAADAQIVPDPYQSSMRREALRQVSGSFHDRGFELQSMRRLPEAFEWYQKGYAVNPNDTRIGEGIRRLESAALQNMWRAQTCGELRQILRYTQDDPPSAAHQQVLEVIARRGC